MRIWFVEIGEPLPQESDVRLHRYGLFARYLARNDCDVTIWASSFSHAPKQHVVTSDHIEQFDGVQYRFLHGPGYARNVSLGRIKHNRIFAKRLQNTLQQLPPSDIPDIIFSPIPIIDAAAVISEFAFNNKIPVIVDIRDEWPDEIVNIAPSVTRPLVRFFFRHSYKQMNIVCNRACALTGVSQRQINYGKRFSPQKPSFPFPLGYPEENVSDAELDKQREELRAEFDYTQFDFICCFFGMMGRYFELKCVVEAASELPNVGFILAGDGKERAAIAPIAQTKPNVYLPGWVKKPKIQAIMSVSDVGLAPYKGSDAFSLPNKPFEYMSGGLAILSTVQGELREIISKNNIGTTIANPTSTNIVQALNMLLNDGDNLEEMKKRSKKLFLTRYRSETVFASVLEQIREYTSD
jgi:glycosyltransferase involved in cell wall biosynthesis